MPFSNGFLTESKKPNISFLSLGVPSDTSSDRDCQIIFSIIEYTLVCPRFSGHTEELEV